MNTAIRQRRRLYRRKKGGRYYISRYAAGKPDTLHTSDRAPAMRLFHSRNEAEQQPAVNLQIFAKSLHAGSACRARLRAFFVAPAPGTKIRQEVKSSAKHNLAQFV